MAGSTTTQGHCRVLEKLDSSLRPIQRSAMETGRRALAFAGVVGGVLYVAGDFLFAAQLDSGQAHRSLAVMSQRSDAVLIAGGVVSPLASAGYILGTLAISLRLRRRYPWLAWAFFVCWAGMFLVGIAYHAVFTTLGFAVKLPDPASADLTLSRIRALLSTFYDGELIFGVVGTLALAGAILRGESGYPRWLLLFTPTAWALAGSASRTLPAPVGGVVAAGWINGWFTVFFLASYLLDCTARRKSEPPNGEGGTEGDSRRDA